MTPDQERDYIELLKECVGELRRLYDNISNSFEQLRTKALAILAGEVAIITFLFAPTDNGSFFGPVVPVYGFVVFGLGIALLIIAFGMFLTVLSSVGWTHPPEEKDIVDLKKRFNNSPVEFLEYLKGEYMGAIKHCIGKTNSRAKRFMIGIYSFSAGITMVVLIKYLSNLIQLGVQ